MRSAAFVVLALATWGTVSCATGKARPPETTTGPGTTWRLELEDAPGHLVTAPRITAFVGQRFNVHIVDQKSYVADFAVERAGDSQIANPVVATVSDAFLFDGTSALRDDGTVELDFTLEKQSPVTPFREETVHVAGRDLRVQRPEVQTTKVHSATRVAPGRRVALAAVPRVDGTGVMTLWGEVAVLSAEEMAATVDPPSLR